MLALAAIAKRLVPNWSAQVCIAFGAWSCQDGLRGNPRDPVQALKKELERRATVLPMNEFFAPTEKTSIILKKTGTPCPARTVDARPTSGIETLMQRKIFWGYSSADFQDWGGLQLQSGDFETKIVIGKTIA
ncbi:hypothetical protein F442_09548 [Phytophthora nicotianae P10297]|uniref:Uncharacterized protein n=1 Tax=Phytophthora nicotianae P10297 TaxID=1317064 RepID=W2Z9Q4_PHYNI|nr:hypothetical protein F442_09548 [Phytophthora nicotianae P10297]